MGRLPSTKSGGLHEAPCRSRRCGIRPVAARRRAGADAGDAAAQAPVREITKIAGEVYRFRNNDHFSVFAVTSAGIIATDPVNAAAATWLKDEMKKRWPDKAIKFVVYSHDHADHISGGEVWADTATVVAHDNAKDGHPRREAADRGAAGHLQRPRDDRSRRHGHGADLCRPQPFQQFAGDALPQGEDHLRRRLHPGERRGVPRLPRRLSRRVDRIAAPGRGAGVRHPGAGPWPARQQGRRDGLPQLPRRSARPGAGGGARRQDARGDQEAGRSLQVQGLGGLRADEPAQHRGRLPARPGDAPAQPVLRASRQRLNEPESVRRSFRAAARGRRRGS